MRIPFSAFLLSDEWSLTSYEHHEHVGSADMLRHLYMLGKMQDMHKPDYCFENNFKTEMTEIGCGKDSMKSEIIVGVLKYLAKRYFIFRERCLYVKREMLEEWMEVVRVFPPLLIEAAYFLDNPDFEREEPTFFHRVLVPNVAETAIKLPYFKNLEKMVRDTNGLTDLHVHINGTAETDMLWWSQIGCIDIWVGSFEEALYYYDVQMEREQLVTLPLKEYKDRIVRSKRILKGLLDNLWDDMNCGGLFAHSHDFWVPTKDRPRLAMGAYFYLKILKLMEEQRLTNEMTKQFHQLMLTLGMVHKMLVQQEWQKGFSQFQMITNNGFRWLFEASHIDTRIAQLNCNKDFNIVQHIEGRFSPKDSLVKNKMFINSLMKGYREYLKDNNKTEEEVRLKLVAHFIKQKDRIPTEHWIRHRALREDVRRKGYALYDWLKYTSIKGKKPYVVGIDAAASEMDASPEVFAPTFKWLRKKWRDEGYDLQVTYHAGEDFLHLLSGLRMMVEAVDFLDLEQGDRIGHGTAAGIDPALWMNRMDVQIKMRKGEWLDDLLMVYDLISHSAKRFDDLMLLLPKLHHEIEDLHKEVYGSYNCIKEMTMAWRLRRYDADVFLKGKVRSDEPKFEEKEKLKKILAENGASKELWYKYHYDTESKIQYESYYDVLIKEGIFTVENLRHIQSLILDKIAHRGIALEVLLTSNKAISFYRESGEHHLERWIVNNETYDDGCMLPPVVIGSDDPGIFMTNIYIEYARIATYLENKNYSYTERMHILRDLIANGEYYKFGD